ITGERSRQLLAKPYGFDFDIGALRTRQLLECRPAHHYDAMPVAPLPMEQSGRGLDQPLPNARRGLIADTNNRTPDGFQGFMGEPILPGVEQVARAREGRLTLIGSHLPPLFSTGSALRGSSRLSPPTPPPPSLSHRPLAPARRLRAPRPRRTCRRQTRGDGTRTVPARAPAPPRPEGAPPACARHRPFPRSARSRWPGRRRARCSAWGRSS